jgi:hypothetical protein
MVSGYLVIIGIFIVYYLAVIFIERRIIDDPRDIIEKFLSVVLLYAGFSLIYWSVTGIPLFATDISEYFVYVFIIGFIAFLWALPQLLLEFGFIRKFLKHERIKIIKKSVKIRK